MKRPALKRRNRMATAVGQRSRRRFVKSAGGVVDPPQGQGRSHVRACDATKHSSHGRRNAAPALGDGALQVRGEGWGVRPLSRALAANMSAGAAGMNGDLLVGYVPEVTGGRTGRELAVKFFALSFDNLYRKHPLSNGGEVPARVCARPDLIRA